MQLLKKNWMRYIVLFFLVANTNLFANERFVSQEKKFSIQTPRGWEVQTDFLGVSYVARAPKRSNDPFQSTLQVSVQNGSVAIDDLTAKQYEAKILEGFAKVTASTNYRMRNYQFIELSDKRPAILYYTEFSKQGVELMQAHILTSSASRNYLITYTDKASEFDHSRDVVSPFRTAWEAMMSFETDSLASGRFDALSLVTLIGVIVVLLISIVLKIRSRIQTKEYRNFSRELERSDWNQEISMKPKKQKSTKLEVKAEDALDEDENSDMDSNENNRTAS